MGSPLAPANRMPYSASRLLGLTAALLGLQFCWAVQVGYVTKTLLQLGMPIALVSYAWLAGPVAGILVQPTVGFFSDRCTSPIGRRRPFLIAGATVTVVCLLSFAFAPRIGRALGDAPPTPSSPRPRALTIAVVSFWALDFAINAAQGPLRALLADVVPPNQQTQGNSYFAFMTGLGNFSGSLLGSMRLSAFFTVFSEDIQALYTIAALVLAATVTCTVLAVDEEPIQPAVSLLEMPPRASDTTLKHQYGRISDDDSFDLHAVVDGEMPSTYASLDMPEPSTLSRADGSANALSGLLAAAYAAPYPFSRIFFIQCFTWFAWFTMFVFATSWVGAEVYNGTFDAANGTPERRLYDAGIRMGNYGLSLQSVFAIFFSLVLPHILTKVSPQTVYFLSHMVLGAALCCAPLLHSKSQAWLATALLAFTGLSWATTMAIPWSLMGQAVAQAVPERTGVYFTLFNLSQCFPEILVSLFAGQVEHRTGTQASVLALGGLSALTGGIFVLALGVGKNMQAEDDQQ